MCEGGSPASCRMYSPRSVSMGVIPFAASASFTPASSESMDFDLIAFLTPCRRQMSMSSSHASARVSAKSTVAPRRTASASKRSSHASRLPSDRSRIAAPSPRSASKSSGPNSATAFARSAVNPVDWNLRRFACKVASASATLERALKCMDWICKGANPRSFRRALRRRAAPASSRRRAGAAAPRCSACSPGRRERLPARRSPRCSHTFFPPSPRRSRRT